MKKGSKGIVLLAIGNKGYAYMAYNMAYSIKHHDPGIRIHLIADECFERLPLERRGVFDSVAPVNKADCYTAGKLDPGKIKTRLYNYLPFEHNLYLDVDGIALQSPVLMLDIMASDERYYITREMGRGKHDAQIGYNIWARNHDIVQHFDLKPDQDIVAIQTSWAYMQRCKKADKFFREVQKEYDKGFPVDKLIFTWGGSMPDELIYSGVIAKMDMNVAGPENLMFFGDNSNKTEGEVSMQYVFLSLYGKGSGRSTTRLKWWEYYDKLLFKWTKQHRTAGDTMATEHIYKSGIVKQYKHANEIR